MRAQRSTALLTAAGLAATLCVAAAPARATVEGKPAPPPISVVMTGLDNPRGLTFGQKDGLYVAEAGRGGTQPCGAGPTGPVSLGPTGAVSRLPRGQQTRIATGLPSLAGAGGIAATGPSDLDFHGRNGLLTIGLSRDPALRPLCPGSLGLGWLAKVGANGGWSLRDDISGYERTANPDGGAFDSDPAGMLKDVDDVAVIADAGANALLAMNPKGVVTTLAVVPSRSSGRNTDSVSNSVAKGPDGAYYVGELTGAPFDVGVANVYRVAPPLGPQVFLSGFTAIIDLDFGDDGSLYVLELATEPFLSGPGALIRVAPNGTRTTLVDDLFSPTSVAIGRDGAAYISNCGIFPGSGPYPCTGHVLRVAL